MLHSQLENELAIYENFKKQRRNDYLSYLVLSRMQEDIERTKRLIDEEECRLSVIAHKNTRGFIHYAQETFRRYWTDRYKYYHSVSRVPASQALQAKAGVR